MAIIQLRRRGDFAVRHRYSAQGLYSFAIQFNPDIIGHGAPGPTYRFVAMNLHFTTTSSIYKLIQFWWTEQEGGLILDDKNFSSYRNWVAIDQNFFFFLCFWTWIHLCSYMGIGEREEKCVSVCVWSSFFLLSQWKDSFGFLMLCHFKKLFAKEIFLYNTTYALRTNFH